MSELGKLLAKSTKNYTPLEAAIVFTYGKHPGDAHDAAAELAQMETDSQEAAKRYVEMFDRCNKFFTRITELEAERARHQAVEAAAQEYVFNGKPDSFSKLAAALSPRQDDAQP